MPAIDVPSRTRLKQRQIQDMDEDLNPYKGYRIIVAQARAGWKARVDTERKYMEFQLTKAGQSKNKEVLRREQLAGPRTDQQYLDNFAIKRKRAQARASSCELAPAGTQEIREQLDAMWNEQSPSEMEEGPLQAPGTLARQLRGSAERMAANPLLCKEEGDEAQDVATMSAAATRWNLFCGFAGQHLNKALSAELGDEVDAVCSTLSVRHLDEAKKLLQGERWGQNTLPPHELAKDARVATEFSQSLSERAQRCEAQCKADLTKGLELLALRKLATMFADIARIKAKYIKRAQRHEASSSSKSAPSGELATAAAEEDSSEAEPSPQDVVEEVVTLAELGVEAHAMHPSMAVVYQHLKGEMDDLVDLAFLEQCIGSRAAQSALQPRRVQPLPQHEGDVGAE